MDTLLEAQCLALAAWQASCQRRPGLHAHQLAALERELALCATASDLAGYHRSGGGKLVGSAAWLDRLAGRLRVAHAVGDELAAAAALQEYRDVITARGAAAGSASWVAAARRAAPLHRRAAVAAASATRTLHSLLLQHTDATQPTEHGQAALAAWQALVAAAPRLALALQGRAPLPTCLRLRLPWQDLGGWTALVAALPPVAASRERRRPDPLAAQARLMADWRRSAAAGVAAATGPMPATDAETALAGWRALAAPADRASASSRAIARVAARALAAAAGSRNAFEVQRRLIESDASAALAAAPLKLQLNAIDARQAAWPQPLLAAHASSLRRALAAAGSDLEVELEVAHAQACLAVEADWQTLLMGVALAPLRAVLWAELGVAGAADGLRSSAELARALLGRSPQALMRLPLLRGPVAAALGQALAAPGGHPDAWQGEAGHELLPPLRALCAQAEARGAARHRGRGGLWPLLCRKAQQHAPARPRSLPRKLHLWDVEADAGDWAGLLAAPARPPLPEG